MFTFTGSFRPAATHLSAVFFSSEITRGLFPRQKLQQMGGAFGLPEILPVKGEHGLQNYLEFRLNFACRDERDKIQI